MYYQSLESNIQKAEQFMEDSTDYKIPQQLLVQLFVSGLKSNTIKKQLKIILQWLGLWNLV